MFEFEKHPIRYVQPSGNLRDMLLEHPNDPIIITTDDRGECFYEVSCGLAKIKAGEVLDCKQSILEDAIFTDRSAFRDALYDYLKYDFDGSEQELEDAVERKEEEYEPYWRPCVILCVQMYKE